MSDWIYTENLGDIRFWELKNWVAHILCLQGEVKFLYAGREFALHEHEVAVIGSPERMTSLNLSANFHCLSYIAPRTFLESQLPGSHYGIGGSVSLYENPILTLDAEQEQWLHDDLERIGNRIGMTHLTFYRSIMGALSLTMMNDLFEIHSSQRGAFSANERPLYVLKTFMELLASGLPEHHRSPSYYAQQLNVSAKYLSDTIRRQTGLSVSHYIEVHVTPIIKNYLDNTDLSVTQIAERMNFSTPTYFARYSRKLLGMSPKEYRASNQPQF